MDSARFQKNDAALRALTEKAQALAARVREGGSKGARARHHARGKLTARERIDLVLDTASPFLEIGLFAGHEVYADPTPGAGLVCGVGWVSGRPCMLVANDATVKGGTYYPLSVKKHLRAQEIAMRNHLPCLYFVDSGGAWLEGQAEVFPDRDHFGRIFRNQAIMSAQGIAQISVVMGPCTAGGAYVPAMSDETIIVEGTGAIYLAGPPLLRAATGEVTDSQSLGGARVHAQASGLADYWAADDRAALAQARRVVAGLGAAPVSTLTGKPPREDPNELYGIVGEDLRKPIDMRAVIARITDDSCFDEFKRYYGETLITGFAAIGGREVAILANNGVLFSESALKGAHFIELACARNIPLLFLHNITGFMVGSRYEAEGIAKHGAKMVMAVSCARVPKISIIVGGSYGAGNYAMCGRAYDPDFIYAWPSARVSVMGGEQAANVMAQIAQDRDPAISEAALDDVRRPLLERFAREAEPFYGSARLWDDGVIDPIQTRDVLAVALAAMAARPKRDTRFGVFRM